MTKVKIIENSWMARIAAYKLKSNSVAMVIGKTIYLHNTTKKDFFSNDSWVRHEVAHIKQYLEFGFFEFIVLYLIESFKQGYEKNRFEVDARQKENDLSILSEVYFI